MTYMEPTPPPTLFSPAEPPRSAPTMRDKFEAFHALHPEVYHAFCEEVEILWRQGHRQFGAQGVFWLVRAKHAVNTQRDHGFKISNNYSPHYARLYIEDHPYRSEFFQLKELSI